MSLTSRLPRLAAASASGQPDGVDADGALVSVYLLADESAEPRLFQAEVSEFLDLFALHEASACTLETCGGQECLARREPFSLGRAARWSPFVDGRAQTLEIVLRGLTALDVEQVEQALSGVAHARYTTHDFRGDETDITLGVVLVLSRPVDEQQIPGLSGAAVRYLGLSGLSRNIEPSTGLVLEMPSHPSDALFASERAMGRLLDVAVLEAASTTGVDENEQIDSTDEESVRDWQEELRRTSRGEVMKVNYNIVALIDGLLPKVFRWNAFAKNVEVIIHDRLTPQQRQLAERIAKSSEHNVPVLLQLEFYAEVDVQFDQDAIAGCIRFVAERDGYNPLTDYLNGIVWDESTSRIDSLFIDYFGAEDTPHNRIIGRRWILGAVARALDPGCKVDNVVIFEGPEGLKKTSGIEALGGRFYSTTEIVLGDKDSKLAASSSWFIELAELRSFKGASRLGVNAFITTRNDFYRAPYGRSMVKTPRMCILIGTTNDEQYLPNEPGNRRYWPVYCGQISVAKILRDKDQIWAEAVAVYKASESCPDCAASDDTVFDQRPRCVLHRWWLDRDEEQTAKQVVKSREETGAIDDLVASWWYSMAPERRPREFSMATVLKEAMKLEDADIAKARATETAVGKTLLHMGFSRRRPRMPNEDGVRPRLYVPSDALMEAPTQTSTRSIGKLIAFAQVPKT